MDGSQLTGIALIITALAAFIGSIATAYVLVRTMLRGEQAKERIEIKVDEVHAVAKEVAREVHTINHLTMGEKSDADESRRIDEIPEGERTPKEQTHIDIVGSPEGVVAPDVPA